MFIPYDIRLGADGTCTRGQGSKFDVNNNNDNNNNNNIVSERNSH